MHLSLSWVLGQGAMENQEVGEGVETMPHRAGLQESGESTVSGCKHPTGYSVSEGCWRHNAWLVLGRGVERGTSFCFHPHGVPTYHANTYKYAAGMGGEGHMERDPTE